MELEDHIFFLCTQVVYRRDRALGEALKPLGLLSTEWRTLGTLLRKGDMTMQELAQWTAYERTRLTRMLHGMEERGWVARTDSSSDGRAVVVRIAPKGEKVYRRAEQAVDKLTEEAMSVCPPGDLARVRKSLQAMRGKLIEMGY
ncbi:MarR family transcriptional regulator [Variovorax dokdonensis]|uniref:MarR family transcriptional regulator n=1 Tax=Variovorax dokdonensis TaxID=344883 RepID=A0ABT7NGF8_9BURK|nr:MarR family transcriptional regulator [Variovorax dokdonensis]MDM0047040.1 MarR family transcriptional regulator [Variovorax dokdonensis]